MNNRFNIENPLLIHAICGGTKCDKVPLEKTGGYLYYEDRPIGRAFLEYCYSVIFGIHRFPGYENYYSLCGYECSWLVESGAISEEDIVSACRELKDLYEFTRAHLGEREVTLYRTLNSAEIRSAKWVDEKIAFHTNIMSSYTQSPNMAYRGDIKIKRTVNTKDILMLDEITAFPDKRYGMCEYRPIVGEHEVWVRNVDRYGRVFIDPDDIVKGKEIFLKEIDKKPPQRQTPAGDCSLMESYVSPYKPCEISKFSRWLTKRNMKKIQRKL